MRLMLAALASLLFGTTVNSEPADGVLTVRRPNCFDAGSMVYCDLPGLIAAPGISITTTPTPKCEDGWTLLTYPGTAEAVCAREIRAPILK